MKLHGTKSLLVTAIALTSLVSHADTPSALELNAFTAGTPAKASEVNENFDNIKSYGEALADTQITHQNAIDFLNTQSAELNSTTSENANSITALTTKANNLVTSVTNHAAAISTLNSNSVILSDSVSTNTTAINAINNEITDINLSITGNASDVSSLTAETTSLSALIAAQSTLIAELQDQVIALQNSSESTSNNFTIPVMGDGELIGYTDRAPKINDDFILVKTESYGLVAIKRMESKFYVLGYDESAGEEAKENGVYFSDSSCTATHIVFNTGFNKDFLVTSESDRIHYSTIVNDLNSTPYVVASDTLIDKVTNNFYEVNFEGVCESADLIAEGIISIPVEKASLEDHGIKESYTEISIQGYVSH